MSKEDYEGYVCHERERERERERIKISHLKGKQIENELQSKVYKKKVVSSKQKIEP